VLPAFISSTISFSFFSIFSSFRQVLLCYSGEIRKGYKEFIRISKYFRKTYKECSLSGGKKRVKGI